MELEEINTSVKFLLLSVSPHSCPSDSMSTNNYKLREGLSLKHQIRKRLIEVITIAHFTGPQFVLLQSLRDVISLIKGNMGIGAQTAVKALQELYSFHTFRKV